MKRSLKGSTIVPDTSVIIEYIVKNAPYRSLVEKLFKDAIKGFTRILISAVTLSEVFYIATRIYRIADDKRPRERALEYLTWLEGFSEIINVSKEIAIRAGELKDHLGIALADCYVIATAITFDAIPLFKKIESEMKDVVEELRNYGVLFIEDLNKSLKF